MTKLDILKSIIVILSLLSTSIIPLFFAFKKAKNDLENAKNDVDREKSIIEMIDVLREIIESVEETWIGVSGNVKKSVAIEDLKKYAKEHKYEFDTDYWESYVDDLVSMTKKVNVNK